MNLQSRTRVSEAISWNNPASDSKTCKYCSARTIPIKYKGDLPSHFVCTQCQIIQVDTTNPLLNAENVSERRKDNGVIIAKGSSLSDGSGIETISRPKYNPLNVDDSTDVILEPSRQNIMDTIGRSLNLAQSKRRQKESDDKQRLRDIFGRNVPH